MQLALKPMPPPLAEQTEQQAYIATGGTAPYTYLWSNGETTASISGLTAGTYTVTVTDLNGCTANCMVTVQEPGCNLSATATGTDVSCNGGNNGTATVTASGNLVPVTYLWSNGSNNRKYYRFNRRYLHRNRHRNTNLYCRSILHRYRTYFVRCSLH
jgi:hypothetical protein